MLQTTKKAEKIKGLVGIGGVRPRGKIEVMGVGGMRTEHLAEGKYGRLCE